MDEDVIFAAVEPLVWTAEAYQRAYGEDDPEELALMQIEDQERARAIAEVLQDLYLVEVDLARPRADWGPQEELGTVADLHALRREAAAAAGYTPEDYYEGRVPPGYRFQHLINHDDTGGYYLPVEFLQPFWLGDEEEGDEPVSVGSAVVLLRELEELRPHLAARYPAEWAAAEAGQEVAGGPVRVWQVLRRLCQAALELDLPVVLG